MDEHKIVFMPGNREGIASEKETLWDAAYRSGVAIGHPCGGAGTCGKCRVRAIGEENFLSPVTETERNMLGTEIASGVRLSCCASVCGSGTVEVLDGQADSAQILHGVAEGRIGPWDSVRRGYGIAADIGTTTVVCCLMNLEACEVTDISSFLNPQIPFGCDVISRISYCQSTPDGLSRMQRAIVDEINRCITQLCAVNGIEESSITEMVVAANTVMEHILMGVSPESIGKSPYTPAFFSHPPVEAQSIGLRINGNLRLMPNVAGYVGGDIIAGIGSLGMECSEKPRMLIDIGTNNEIAISGSAGMFCCAAAAGPALEGARIHQGMRAGIGAIETVCVHDGRLVCGVIGGFTPEGICGSGLIDAVSVLLNEGLVDRSGRFTWNSDNRTLLSRMDKTEKGMSRFLLTDLRNPVYLTQKDIREVQLAVGAIKVGTDVMLEAMGIGLDELDAVYIAGAFGNYIDVNSAVNVGLLPAAERCRIKSVHNTSGLGACMAMASSDFYRRTLDIHPEYIELSSLKDFQGRFVKAMSF